MTKMSQNIDWIGDVIDSLKSCAKFGCKQCKFREEDECSNNLVLEAARIIEGLLDEIGSMLDPVKQSECKHHEKIDHPDHYQGNIECIDYIKSLGLGRGFCLGNAIKYLHRAGHKNGETTQDDLNKAMWYINSYLESGDDKP